MSALPKYTRRQLKLALRALRTARTHASLAAATPDKTVHARAHAIGLQLNADIRRVREELGFRR